MAQVWFPWHHAGMEALHSEETAETYSAEESESSYGSEYSFVNFAAGVKPPGQRHLFNAWIFFNAWKALSFANVCREYKTLLEDEGIFFKHERTEEESRVQVSADRPLEGRTVPLPQMEIDTPER